MSFKSFMKTTKGKVIIAAVAVVAVAGVVAAVLLLMNGKTYRSIITKEVSGSVNITGEINNGAAYAGERLYGGDDVSVMSNSSLTMLVDNDKYLMAEENTHFLLKSERPDNTGGIKIILDKGSVLNELRSKLSVGDSYEVDTPNSTMSVRGTKFNVTVYTEGDISYTLVEVIKGIVTSKLRTADGTYTGIETTFYAGESVIIKGGRDFSEFVTDKNGNTVRRLNLPSLPANGTERLIALLDGDKKESAPSDEDVIVTESTVTEAPETSTETTTTTEDTTVPPTETTSADTTTTVVTTTWDDTTVPPTTTAAVTTTTASTTTVASTTKATTTTATTTVRTSLTTTKATTTTKETTTTTTASTTTTAVPTEETIADRTEETYYTRQTEGSSQEIITIPDIVTYNSSSSTSTFTNPPIVIPGSITTTLHP